jgi:hypothetical protein
MPAILSSYIVPFDPLGNPLGTILTAAQRYNRGFKRIKRDSAVAPYPNPATIYCQSAIADPGDDMFEDVYMGDMYSFFFCFRCWLLTMNDRVMANKWISRHSLLVDTTVKGNL